MNLALPSVRAPRRSVRIGASLALLASGACTHPVSNATPGDVATTRDDRAKPSAAEAEEGDLPPGRVTIDDPGIFSIPLESGVLPIVRCELDGAASRFALLDTGAEGSLISPSQAGRMRCERRKMEPLVVSSPSAAAEMDTYLRVPQVLLGLMKIRDPSLPVAALPLDLDCLLGSGVLTQTTMWMEAKSRRVTFGSVSRIEEAVRKKHPGDTLTDVRLTPAQRLFTLVVETGSGPMKLLLDTGAMRTMVNPLAMKVRNVDPTYTHEGYFEDFASARTGELEFFRIRDVKLGEWTFDVDAVGQSGPLFDELQLDGILGFDVLGRIPWVFDPAATRIVVVSPPGGDAGHLPIGSDDPEADLRRMCADTYEPFTLAALGTISIAHEPSYLDIAGPLLADPRSRVGEMAAYAIMKTLGEKWRDDEMHHAAIQWWRQRDPSEK